MMRAAHRRQRPLRLRCAVGLALFAWPIGAVLASSADLRVGIAGHAFDHLGGIGNQATTAGRSGANIIYVTGLGGIGYNGLPDQTELTKQRQATIDYLSQAKRNGIRLAIGYVCATSMVKLDQFDRHW